MGDTHGLLVLIPFYGVYFSQRRYVFFIAATTLYILAVCYCPWGYPEGNGNDKTDLVIQVIITIHQF